MHLLIAASFLGGGYMWSTRKRKHDASPTSGDSPDDSLLHVRAYEADICCNPASARSLEANGLHIGEALIKHSTGESEIWVDRYVRYISWPSRCALGVLPPE